jgi:hypothetical protein
MFLIKKKNQSLFLININYIICAFINNTTIIKLLCILSARVSELNSKKNYLPLFLKKAAIIRIRLIKKYQPQCSLFWIIFCKARNIKIINNNMIC